MERRNESTNSSSFAIVPQPFWRFLGFKIRGLGTLVVENTPASTFNFTSAYMHLDMYDIEKLALYV